MFIYIHFQSLKTMRIIKSRKLDIQFNELWENGACLPCQQNVLGIKFNPYTVYGRNSNLDNWLSTFNGQKKFVGCKCQFILRRNILPNFDKLLLISQGVTKIVPSLNYSDFLVSWMLLDGWIRLRHPCLLHSGKS